MPRLDMSGLVESEMSASPALRVLGMDLLEEADAKSHVVAPFGGMPIAWDTVEVAQVFSDCHAQQDGHGVAPSFLCASSKDVDELRPTLTNAGYRSHVGPPGVFVCQRRKATVLYPDDNPVALLAQLN